MNFKISIKNKNPGVLSMVFTETNVFIFREEDDKFVFIKPNDSVSSYAKKHYEVERVG